MSCFGFLEAGEQVAEALDLPRAWSESEDMSACVRRIVDAVFVVSAGGAYEWRPEFVSDADPMQERWWRVVRSSGVLEFLS
jgi:hypothetical protein